MQRRLTNTMFDFFFNSQGTHDGGDCDGDDHDHDHDSDDYANGSTVCKASSKESSAKQVSARAVKLDQSVVD